MSISTIAAGYVSAGITQPKPPQPRPVHDDDGRTRPSQQQAALQAAAKGSVNLLV